MFATEAPFSVLRPAIAGVVFRQLFDWPGSAVVLPAQPAPPAPAPVATAAAAALSTSGLLSGSGSARGRVAHPSGAARRRDIFQCRSLRTVIHAYEAQFEKTHARKPRGSERGHLTETYAQYRALKQRIRDDAATHIQTVWRGHRTRKGLPSLPRRSRGAAAAVAATTGDAPGASGPGRGAPAAAAARLAPSPARPSSAASSVSAASTAAADATAGPRPAASQLQQPQPTTVSLRDRLEALRAEKSALKARLRAFDDKFQADHGRQPSKAEKEPLRPQYQAYHNLKTLIATLEGAMGGGTASAAAADSANTSGAAGVGSPVSASHAGSATPLSPAAGAATSRSAVSVSSSAGGSVVGAGATATPRTPSSSSVGDTSAAQLGSGLGATSSSSAAAAALLSAAASDEACLRELRAEKKRLQLFLRDYERAFEQREGRKVQFVKDIQPVLEQYQRYKLLKTAIKDLT